MPEYPWQCLDFRGTGQVRLTPVPVIRPLKAGPTCELAATERDRVADGRSSADGIEPLAASFGACPVRADAAVGAAVPSASAELVSVVDPDDRSDGRHPERPGGPARPEPSLPISTRRRRELVSELGAHAVGLVQQAGAGQERPAAVTAVTATTPL